MILIGGMLASAHFLRAMLTAAYGLQMAVYLGNGIGMMLGAVANLVFFLLIGMMSRTEHHFLYFGPRSWSLFGVLAGLGMIGYSWTLRVPA